MKKKVRLVAQGYNQEEVIDFNESYAPVAVSTPRGGVNRCTANLMN